MEPEGELWAISPQRVARDSRASESGSRIRTATIGNREKREPRRLIGLEFAISGSDSLGALSQNPAKGREILGLSPGVRPKSLQPETVWRWGQVKPQPLVAVNRGKWRLIYPAAQPKQVEIFDKEAAPAEQRSLADEHTEVVADLTAVANSYFESRPPPWGTDAPTVELDEMEMDQLRALGYGVQ